MSTDIDHDIAAIIRAVEWAEQLERLDRLVKRFCALFPADDAPHWTESFVHRKRTVPRINKSLSLGDHELSISRAYQRGDSAELQRLIAAR